MLLLHLLLPWDWSSSPRSGGAHSFGAVCAAHECPSSGAAPHPHGVRSGPHETGFTACDPTPWLELSGPSWANWTHCSGNLDFGLGELSPPECGWSCSRNTGAVWPEGGGSPAAETGGSPRRSRVEGKRENLTRFFQSLLKARQQSCRGVLRTP